MTSWSTTSSRGSRTRSRCPRRRGAPLVAATTTEEEETEDEDEDVVLDLEDEEDPTDVEDPLDVLLRERISSDLEDDDDLDDDDEDEDDRTEGGSRIPSRRPGEFVCTSCFLVKAPSQLADATRILCRDCV